METENNNETQEAVKIFIVECEEILEDFEAKIIEYEKNNDYNIITDVKRNIHSLKGSAGILGLNKIQNIAHKIEDTLTDISEKADYELKNSVTTMFSLSDEIKLLLEKTKENILISPETIINEIIKLIPGLKKDIKISEKLIMLSERLLHNNLSPEYCDVIVILEKIINEINKSVKIKDVSIINILSGSFKTLKTLLSEKENKGGLIFTKQKLNLAYQMIDGYLEKSREFQDNLNNEKKLAPKKLKRRIDIGVLDNLQQGAFRTLRVEISKIDKLYYNIQYIEKEIFEFDKKVSDVLISVAKFSKEIQNSEKCINSLLNNIDNDNKNSDLIVLKNNIDNVQKILKTFKKQELYNKETENGIFGKIFEMKNDIKNIRTLPIGVILHMFPRMARDIASGLGKEIEFEISGGQISVDKTIIEEIKMPLLHILRNAVGHGIELPEEREKQGKQRAGKIEISVRENDNMVIISVKDDGCGININKIKEKAIKDKIIEKSKINNVSEPDLLNIILRPGFSTEDKITEISGRGMGLDIVNNKVQSLNGGMKILTEKNKGTEFILYLPTDKHIKTVNTGKKQIVFVDDSPVTRIYFSKILNNNKYSCICFSNAKNALSYLKDNSCDLIITDIEMPEINGYEFVQILKNENINIPVIVISMMDEKRAKEKFKDIKIKYFINKSEFSEDKFFKTVEEIIQ